jgi:hypothetical protein
MVSIMKLLTVAESTVPHLCSNSDEDQVLFVTEAFLTPRNLMKGLKCDIDGISELTKRFSRVLRVAKPVARPPLFVYTFLRKM